MTQLVTSTLFSVENENEETKALIIEKFSTIGLRIKNERILKKIFQH